MSRPANPDSSEALKRAIQRIEAAPDEHPLRLNLSHGGVLHLDRRLPFLLIHRAPPTGADAGTAHLLTGEAAYLLSVPGEEEEVAELARAIAKRGSSAFGAFCIIEIWSSRRETSQSFVVHAPEKAARETADKLVEALESLRELDPGLIVETDYGDRRHPPDLFPLLSVEESWKSEVLVLGLEVPPIYRDPETGRLFPVFLRGVRAGLSRALRQSIHEFVRIQTTVTVEHHLALGTQRLPDIVWQVDRDLCAIERSFDLLLLVTPINGEEARAEFEASRFSRNPQLHNRLLPFDPDLLKRRLFDIPMERIEDPAIAELYRDKRTELDLILSLLGDRGSERFRSGSQRLYGMVGEGLRARAERLLEEVPPAGPYDGPLIDAAAFRERAEEELRRFGEVHMGLDRRAEIRRDITGLLVSEGNLLIGEDLSLRPDRVEPLIHHEVGTHVLTYVNGAAQPLEQLALGLAQYDELQEGLAVLAEYLAGGLDALRMRLLAARVLAARSVEQGADFVETFRMLTKDLGYSRSGAWHIALRVHASGGFTRDFIYLRGLVHLLEYLVNGGDLLPLYVGKMALKHLPIIEELRHRKILREPPLVPPLLSDPDALRRLQAIRDGITLTEMTCHPAR